MLAGLALVGAERGGCLALLGELGRAVLAAVSGSGVAGEGVEFGESRPRGCHEVTASGRDVASPPCRVAVRSAGATRQPSAQRGI